MAKNDKIDIAEAVRIGMFATGLALVSYGAWLINEPYGFIVGGTMMFSCAVIGASRSKK